MRNQNLFFLLLLLLISFLISRDSDTSFINNVSAISLKEGLKYISNCFPLNKPDPETGCRICGETGDESIKIAYEECRQAYYLKKQTEFIASQQISQGTLAELESKNQQLQELLEGQNTQIEGLIQELDEQSQKINTLVVSLKNAGSLNIGLAIILGVFLIGLVMLFIKRKNYKQA